MTPPSLHLRGVSLGHAAHEPLLKDVDLHLLPGWYGVVGANGAGKTTLLGALHGVLEPLAGERILSPAGARVHLCPQDVDVPPADVSSFMEDSGGVARSLRGRLHLDADMLRRWDTLSPGERRRWQVATALWLQPHVLLLDEPGNHVDAEASALVTSALREFEGVGVLVSHDRLLLDELTTATLRVHAGRVTCWPGSYSRARNAWEQEEREARQQREALQQSARRQQRQLASTRHERGAAQRQRNARTRMRDRNDSDARGVGANFRAESAEKRLGRAVASARGRLERTLVALDDAQVERRRGGDVEVRGGPAPFPRVLQVVDADVCHPDGTPHLRGVTLAVGRDDRIHLRGANGAGKSTLMRALGAWSRLPPERVFVLPQEVDEEGRVALLDELAELDPDTRGEVLSWVSRLGADPAVILRSARPSPGEARKLALSLGMVRPSWLLLLDEPQNHLDLPAVERLADALSRYGGAMVLATHDSALAERCTSRAWYVRKNAVGMLD